MRKQNVEFLNVKPAGTHKSNGWNLKGHCTKADESVVWFGGQKMWKKEDEISGQWQLYGPEEPLGVPSGWND